MSSYTHPAKHHQNEQTTKLAKQESKQLFSRHPFYINSSVGKILASPVDSTATGSATTTQTVKREVPFGSTNRLLKAKFDSDGYKIDVDDRDRAKDPNPEFCDPGEYDRNRRDGDWDGKGRTVDEMVKMGEVRRAKGVEEEVGWGGGRW